MRNKTNWIHKIHKGLLYVSRTDRQWVEMTTSVKLNSEINLLADATNQKMAN